MLDGLLREVVAAVSLVLELTLGGEDPLAASGRLPAQLRAEKVTVPFSRPSHALSSG